MTPSIFDKDFLKKEERDPRTQAQRKADALLCAKPEPIDYPLFFNGGSFLQRVIKKDGIPLRSIIFISAGLSLQDPLNKIVIQENDFKILGESEDGIKIYNPREERINQRSLPFVDWRTTKEPIHASLSILIGIYADGEKKKLSEITNGYMLGGFYKVLQNAILERILNSKGFI